MGKSTRSLVVDHYPTTTDGARMTGFLDAPEPDDAGRRLFAEDVADVGHVMNLTRLWAYQPSTLVGLFDLLGETVAAHGLTFRQRGILVAACASAHGDSYCSLAWGSRLADATDADTAAAVLRGDDGNLTAAEQAMAAWARKVTRDPNGTTVADVQVLRDNGFTDAEVFGLTVFTALRLAFSTVNDALGARPDAQLGASAPAAVLDAVKFGRPIAER
jgi:alkylhydroperoxidase family enzyme